MADQSYLDKIAELPDAPLQDGVRHAAEMAPKIVDVWAWWRKALANPSEIGKSLLIHEGDPQQGYYRSRFKKGPWEPVAIWQDNGEWLAYRGGKEVRADEIWTYVCTNPVSYEDYNRALDGHPWPDEDATVAAQLAPPAPGHNSGSVDEAEEIADQIAASLKGLEAYKTIGDDETNAKALSLRNRLNELSGKADKIRVKQKEPHFEAGKAVDAKWQPLVKSAKTGADTVRAAMDAFETKKLRDQREAARVAEVARQAREDAARAAQPAGEIMEAPAPVSAPVASAPAAIKPAYGKAASVQVKTIVKDVTDWAALYAYMANREEVQTLLRSLAQKAIDAGRTNIPGITTEEKAQVR